jgi:hypothetical protein
MASLSAQADLEEVGVTQIQANQIGGGSQLECPGRTINATMQGLAIPARVLIQPLARSACGRSTTSRRGDEGARVLGLFSTPGDRIKTGHFIEHLAHGISILGFGFLC